MPSVLILSLLAVSALVTSFISGILGMAGGMILMGILLAVLPLPAAMMLHGITQLASNAWRAFLWRTEVDWRVFRGYLYGALLTLALFAVVRFVVSKPVALVVMGLTPFITLALPEKLHLNVERRGHSLACGVVCTGLSLTASLSHVLKIAYFGAFVAVEGGAVHPWLAAMMVVLAFIGTSLSRGVLERMNDASFRFWTRWTVMSLGVFYLGSGILLLVR
jgi:uncharacterized protein